MPQREWYIDHKSPASSYFEKVCNKNDKDRTLKDKHSPNENITQHRHIYHIGKSKSTFRKSLLESRQRKHVL